MPRVTKADLEKEVERLKKECGQWEEQCHSLQDDVDYYINQNDKYYEELEELRNTRTEDSIKFVDNFINYLKIFQGYSDNDCIFDYINEYMRYYND